MKIPQPDLRDFSGAPTTRETVAEKLRMQYIYRGTSSLMERGTQLSEDHRVLTREVTAHFH